MSPLTLNPLALLVGGALAVAIGFGSGWTANGWRLDAEISSIKADRASDRADQAQAALTDLAEAAKKIKDAADGAGIEFFAVNTQLADIKKDLKNANAKPLPPDCRPDTVRVRSLAAAVDATNKAAAGLGTVGTVSNARKP
jgi:hypothetical protein